MLIDFCLPILNEEKILSANIQSLLKYLENGHRNFDWQIIILDNGSTDESRIIADKLVKKYPAKIKLKSLVEKGKGRALKNYFIESRADILIYMDIDLAVSLHNIDDLVKNLTQGNNDLVFGSRLLSDSIVKRPFPRELSSRIYNSLARLILRHKFKDLQCGFKGIKKTSFLKIAGKIKNPHWFFDTELILFAKKNGLKIKEMPVDWQENRYNERKSRINLLRDSFSFLYNLIKLRLRL